MPKFTATLSLAMLMAFSAGAAKALDVPGPLVQTDWLAANLKNRQLILLDVRTDVQNFNNEPPPKTKVDPKWPGGHIPGARLWDFRRVRENRVIGQSLLEKVVPARASFEATMRDFGVRNTSAVVVVANANDSAAFTMGTRAYWTLKYYGHDNVALLDGGTTKWAAEKRTRSFVSPVVEKSGYTVARERKELLASTDEVEAALRDRTAQLVDGRTADFYVGQRIDNDVRARGHIAGAKMLSHVELLDEKAKILKSPDALQELAKRYDIDVAQPIIVFSNTGHLGSGAWFVLSELLGNPAVQLYDGSMHEWTRNPARPVSVRWEMDGQGEEAGHRETATAPQQGS